MLAYNHRSVSRVLVPKYQEEIVIVPNDHSGKTVSRRRALAAISGSLCAAINLPRAAQALPTSAVALPRIPQVAANLSDSARPLFTTPQLETIAALSEVIIPADEHSPGARAARVDRFIAEIVGISDRPTIALWLSGLSAVDKLARAQWGKVFVDCSAEQQYEIVRRISLGERHPSTLEERFFVAVKQATVDGYYNSEIGIHEDLKYQGNTALAEFKGCTHPSHGSAT
jgi:hypothetical protein